MYHEPEQCSDRQKYNDDYHDMQMTIHDGQKNSRAFDDETLDHGDVVGVRVEHAGSGPVACRARHRHIRHESMGDDETRTSHSSTLTSLVVADMC